MFKYKKLYKIELNNRKLIEERKRQIEQSYIETQKKLLEYKEKYAKIYLDCTDLEGFLKQEKECNNALRKERTKLRRRITILEKELINSELENTKFFSNKSGKTEQISYEQFQEEMQELLNEGNEKTKKGDNNGKRKRN